VNYLADFLHRIVFGRPSRERHIELYVEEAKPGPAPIIGNPKEAMALFTLKMWKEFNFETRPDGWKNELPADVFVEMSWVMCKIGHAVRGNRPGAVAEHAADLANLAMILTDVSGALREEEGRAA
jgi:hypothetical protein